MGTAERLWVAASLPRRGPSEELRVVMTRPGLADLRALERPGWSDGRGSTMGRGREGGGASARGDFGRSLMLIE